MKKVLKKIATALAVAVVVVGVAVGAGSQKVLAASDYETPLEALAALTGKTEETLRTELAEPGVSLFTIAEENGVLDEFEAEVKEIRKDNILAKVASGLITQERADQMIQRIDESDSTFGFMGRAYDGFGGCLGNGARGGYGPMMGYSANSINSGNSESAWGWNRGTGAGTGNGAATGNGAGTGADTDNGTSNVGNWMNGFGVGFGGGCGRWR